MKRILHDNLNIGPNGHLMMGGVDTVDMAEKYGTPLYLMDENRIRMNAKTYVEAMRESFGESSVPLYAGKALCFKGIYPIIEREGMYADVVSSGEIFTAMAADFPVEHLFFHGDNKTYEDVEYAITEGVGYFVVDNMQELDLVNQVAGEKGIVQDILLRITVGLDPHTLEAIKTGKVDSQFGLPIATGQAEKFVEYALDKSNLNLLGFHSHIGSQISEDEPFIDQMDILLKFAADMRDKFGYIAKVFNIGGGFGIRYVEDDPCVDVKANIKAIGEKLDSGCMKFDFPRPRIFMEPGRSIVGDAGITLYTVGGVKTIEGYRSYITVDGGMTDNPRYALYKSPYTVLLANKADEKADFNCTVAGRCCESGDRIQENIDIAKPEAGDILAVLSTGAYNYSMASNYNRLRRLPIVMIKDGTDRLVVRRETFEDLIKCDL